MILLTKILIGCGLALVSVGTAWWAKSKPADKQATCYEYKQSNRK